MFDATTTKSENAQWGERMATYIALRRWNGYSVQEIADTFGISRQQVYLHLQKIPFPNDKAKRYPRPALNEEQVRSVVGFLSRIRTRPYPPLQRQRAFLLRML